MKTVKSTPALDRLVGPLGECLTPETARRLLALKADAKLQARVSYLAERNTVGLLTPEELAEYADYVSFSTFIAILKSRSRKRDSVLFEPGHRYVPGPNTFTHERVRPSGVSFTDPSLPNTRPPKRRVPFPRPWMFGVISLKVKVFFGHGPDPLGRRYGPSQAHGERRQAA
jgi:hypothetical protein